MSDSVIGIVLNKEKTSVVLVQRRDVLVWVLPGGGVDAGESPEDAIIREIKEETGLDVVIERKVAEYSPLNRLTKLTFTFECLIVGGHLSTSSETKNVAFFPIDQFPESFFSLHLEWLKDALAFNKETIKKTITQVTYRAIFIYLCKHPVNFLRYLLSRLGFPINSK